MNPLPTPTEFWWVRHFPTTETGRYIGQTDVPAIMPAPVIDLAVGLPEDAHWFASPLKRSQQSAHWLMKFYLMNTESLKTAHSLMEQHFGDWEGSRYEDIWEHIQHQYDWSKPEAVRPVRGESFEDVCTRVDRWCDEQLTKLAGKKIIAIAHAGTIRAALRHALKLTHSQALAFQVNHASITRMVYYPGEKTGGVYFVNQSSGLF